MDRTKETTVPSPPEETSTSTLTTSEATNRQRIQLETASKSVISGKGRLNSPAGLLLARSRRPFFSASGQTTHHALDSETEASPNIRGYGRRASGTSDSIEPAESPRLYIFKAGQFNPEGWMTTQSRSPSPFWFLPDESA
jgi:hypothetical protein